MMTKTKPECPTVAAELVPVRSGSGYPAPYAAECQARQKRALGDVFGLSDFGVNLVTLPAGAWSSQRHWHSTEDEFVYILHGAPVLVTDAGRTQLGPGMCAGFPAASPNGHHLINDTTDEVVYLEVGSRRTDDDVDYPDIDMQIKQRGKDGVFSHKDGRPYS